MDDGLMKAALALSRTIAWLFASKAGLLTLLVVSCALVVFRLSFAARRSVLLEKAAGKKGGFMAGARGAANEAASGAAWAASNLPTLVASLAVLALVVGLSGVVTRFEEYLGLQERIREYSIVLKNLEARTRVARVECLSKAGAKGRYLVEYYGGGEDGKPASREEFELEGDEIYLDALVLNFDYAGIASGERVNVAVPYRAFSDLVPQSKGRVLAFSDAAGRPFYLSRNEEDIRGMPKDAYDARIDEISAMFKSDSEARKAGVVRSVYGNAVHRPLRKGEAFIVWVEQSGGLTIKEEKDF